MSAAEIIAQLSQARQMLEEARTRGQAAAAAAEQARGLTAKALEGTGGGAQLINALKQVQEGFVRAVGATGPARQQVEQTIARVHALGN